MRDRLAAGLWRPDPIPRVRLGILQKINTADFAMGCAADIPDLEQKKLELYQPRYAHSHPAAALSSLTIVFSCSSYHACSHSGRFKSGRKNPEPKT